MTADRYFWNALLSRKLFQGYATYFFYAQLVMGEDSWGIPDRWVEKLLEAADVPMEELEAINNLQLFPSNETFFRWCPNSAYPDTPTALAPSSSGAKKKKKRRGLKRPHLSTEEELARKEEANLQMVVALSLKMACVVGFDASPPEAPSERDHSRTMDPGHVGSPKRIPIIAKERHSTDPVSVGSSDEIPIATERRSASAESPLLLEDSTGPYLLEGGPQVIVIKEEGDPTPASTSMGEPEPLVHLRVLAATFGEPSLSKSDKEVFRCPFDMEGREVSSFDLKGSWLGDLFGVSLIMDANKHRKIIGAGKCLEEMGIPFLLSGSVWRPPSRRLCPRPAAGWKKSLRLRWSNAMLKARQRGSDTSSERLKEDIVGLLTDLAATKVERDEAVDDAEATILAKQDLEKALLDANVEMISLQGQQLEADSSLHCLADQGEQVGSRAELDAARGEVSFLRGQVALLGLREAKLLSDFVLESFIIY
ncbi:hypothetical protein ACLOJK_022087 [Asimina triloba]